jgi:hypothetical protein
MGSLIKEKGHELLSFDYDNIMADIFGDAMLASRNKNPDPLLRIVNANGKMKYFKLGHAPRPDGWGVFVKGPNASDAFSEQNDYPLPMGDTPFYDLDHPLINGQPLPEAREYVDIAQPEAPRAVLFTTGDKAYPTGWYTAGYAWRMDNPFRVTTPDPDTAGFPGTRGEAFQMSGSLGMGFYIPQPPKNAKYIVFYLTNVQSTSAAAITAPMFEQFAIEIDDNRSDVVEFRGPLKTGTKAPTGNKTKLEEWGGPGGFDIDKVRYKKKNKAYDVQFGYQLVDASGHSVGTTSKVFHLGENSHKRFRFRPSNKSLNQVVKDSVKGWTPFVRYRKGGDWGKWQSIKRQGSDNVFKLGDYVYVYGPDGWRKTNYDLIKGEPSKKDTSGIPNATEPMTAIDATISLTSSGLQTGKHRIKAVLYDGSEPSEPSEATVVDVTASNQVPRVYQPFFTNVLDNPDNIDTAGTTSRPRDWTFNRDSRTTYEKGRLTVDETDGQATRGDLVVTPYGWIGLSELKYGGRIIIEQAKHVTGKSIDILMEYRVNSYSATGVPNVTFLQQSTLGVHRRNGRYQLGFRTKQTRARDAIPLHAQTNLVVIKTIGDGSDPNLGVRNYTTIRKGHGIFRTLAPNKRKTAEFLDKVDWWEPDDESYPHGGYCRVVNNGEDPTIQGITMNGNDTGLTIPGNTSLNGTSRATKTIEVRFRTGEDITSNQVLYREGDATNGYSLSIGSGSLNYRVWTGGVVQANHTTTVRKHEKYIASVARGSDSFRSYLDGVLVTNTAITIPAFASGGTISAGFNNGTYRTAASATSTATNAFLGRLYEIRSWKVYKSGSFITANYASIIEDADDIANLDLYLLMDEMEGTTVYDNSGNGSNATIVGDSRWINGDFNAAWHDASGMIDRLNFADNTVPAPWSLSGAATSTLGDFSASRFSDYGLRKTGPGTNLRYVSRTLSGIGSTFTMGIQKRFITLPTGGNPTLMQIRDATGVVAEAQLTTGGQLQVRGPGAGAWTTFLSGVEAGERMYFEVRCENLGSASGIIRVMQGSTHEEELAQLAMLTGVNFGSRGVTEVRAGNCAVSASITNTWDFHIGEVILSTYGKVKKQYLPGNYVEYYGPEGTPVNEHYGIYDLAIPVTPSTQYTHSVYAYAKELTKGEDQILGATVYNKDDEEVDQLAFLVNFNDIEEHWTRFSKTFTTPDDAAYIVYDRNNVGAGQYRFQAMQLELGGSTTAFTARHDLSGYVRVKFDSIIEGCDLDSPVDVLGKVEDLLTMGFIGFEDDNTTITLQIASAATKNGTYSAYFNDIDTVPQNRWYEVKATLATTDRNVTPILKGIYMNFKRAFPMVHKPNGEEYLGGTLINNMPPPLGRRLVEIHQMDDGSGGFTTWGGNNPRDWIEPFELHVFRDSVADEISSNVGKGDSTFMIEYDDVLYTVRVVEPIEFEIRRRSYVELGGEDDEDFYWYTATIPRSEVIEVQDL